LDRRSFVVVHACPLATPLDADVHKTAQIVVFAAEGDRINRSRRNFGQNG